jgi:Spx/MgsR family transcriptional regulator
MSTTLYGISNCDTVRKARRWLDEHGITYHFHDFRKDGLSPEQLKHWLSELGADSLVNKRGTTFRQLSASEKECLDNDPGSVLSEHPALIKRPLLNTGKHLHVGFSDTQYQNLFRSHTL